MVESYAEEIIDADEDLIVSERKIVLDGSVKEKLKNSHSMVGLSGAT